jgi:hypothetical protein
MLRSSVDSLTPRIGVGPAPFTDCFLFRKPPIHVGQKLFLFPPPPIRVGLKLCIVGLTLCIVGLLLPPPPIIVGPTPFTVCFELQTSPLSVCLAFFELRTVPFGVCLAFGLIKLLPYPAQFCLLSRSIIKLRHSRSCHQ